MDDDSPLKKVLPWRASLPKIVAISTSIMAVPTQGEQGMQIEILNRTVCVDSDGRAWALKVDEKSAMNTWEALPELPMGSDRL